MSSSIEWGVWIAACSFIVGLAKFLDDYHVRNDVRSKTRDWLIIIFMFLEQPHIENYPQVIYGYVATAIKRLGKWAWLGTIPVAYFTMVSAFYFGRVYFEDPPSTGFIEYALTWVNSFYWALIIIWGVCAGVLGFISVGVFLERWNNVGTLISQWAFSIMTLILTFMIASGTSSGFSFLGDGDLNPDTVIPGLDYSSTSFMMDNPSAALIQDNPYFLYVLTASCLWHAIAISVTMFLLTGLRTLYLIIHKGLLSVLNAASNPKVSPFQYFAALIALSSLALKMVEVLFD